VETTPSLDRDQVTVVVFKDNYAARSFKVPLGWFSRIGAGVGLLVLSTALVSLIAVKYYRLAHQGDPGRIGSLEEEIHELKSLNETLAAKSKAATEALATAAKNVAPVPVPAATATVTATPVATVTATATPAAIPTIPALAVPITAGNVLLFRDLPLNVLAPSDPASIPISVLMQKVAWKGKTLNVQFAIQYTGTAAGNQQGRIVILARGPSALMTYPEQAFNPGTSPALIAPERGEYFSVSRYRETRAEFAGLTNTDALKEVEILIFGSPAGASDESGFELLIHQRVPIEAAPKVAPKPVPKPKPKVEPKHETETQDDSDEPAAPSGAAKEAPAAPAQGAKPEAPAASEPKSEPAQQPEVVQ
jgi:hypothetical protein